jgi:hypothetical protein
MTLPVPLDLQVTVGCSFSAVATVSATLGAQLGLLGATGELRVAITPEDDAPLVDVTTTSSDQGELTFGVTFPSPAGLPAASGGALVQLGTLPSVATSVPQVSATVATLVALGNLTTTPFSLGSVAYVTASSGSYFAWSPLDPSTPNGTTIIAGAGATGNWLLCGTVTIELTPTATAALQGYDVALWTLLVTFGDGEVVPLMGGRIFVLPPQPPPT